MLPPLVYKMYTRMRSCVVPVGMIEANAVLRNGDAGGEGTAEDATGASACVARVIAICLTAWTHDGSLDGGVAGALMLLDP